MAAPPPPTPPPRPGILHQYAPGLIAFEQPPAGPAQTGNTLLFVGGLGDGIATIPYIGPLSTAVTGAGWSLVEVLLSSSYKGWGVGSIAKFLMPLPLLSRSLCGLMRGRESRDAEELAECVGYFRGIRDGKVVLMGHSTGCQDALEYLSKDSSSSRPPLSGVILQGGVSDREAAALMMGPEGLAKSLDYAASLCSSGRGSEIVPSDLVPGGTPISAQRWWNLSALRGADDFFSSDLPDSALSETFGRIPAGTRVLFLFSGSDQFVPEAVDKEGLLARWYRACEEAGALVDKEGSGVVEGASHNLEGTPQEVVANMVGRVVRFLEGSQKEE